MKIDVPEIHLYTANPNSRLLARCSVKIDYITVQHIYIRKPGKTASHVNWPQLRSPARAPSISCDDPDVGLMIKQKVLDAYWEKINDNSDDEPDIEIPFG